MRAGLPVSVVSAACAVVLAAGCSSGPGAVDRHDVEKKIAGFLEPKTGQRPGVTCPDDLEATVGTTMRCTLAFDDGTRIGVTVKVLSVKGKHVGYHFQVDKKPLPAS